MDGFDQINELVALMQRVRDQDFLKTGEKLPDVTPALQRPPPDFSDELINRPLPNRD